MHETHPEPGRRPTRRQPVTSRTTAIDDPGDLIALLPGGADIAWIRRGDGFIATGEAVRAEFDTIDEADRWWSEYSAGIEHVTEFPGTPGVGPLAFGSFVFDPGHTGRRSVMIVPELIIGRRDGRCWITRTGHELPGTDTWPAVERPVTGPSGLAYADGALTGPAWESAVAEAVSRLRAGDLDKVVLARDLIAEAETPIDPRWLAAQLAPRYDRCWTYIVDDMVGASPEMLVRRENGLVTSRVLAGTIQRSDQEWVDVARASSLSSSSKDLNEHEYAVNSVAKALAPYCSGMNVPDAPYVLELPNVFHLATDVTAVAKDDASSLALAAALHPSAAVCGTPTDAARRLIRELEGMDRGRYSGPVGWVDLHGDGEWAIALRCGQITGRTARLFAGCGIMADSDPEAELTESNAKLVPMRDALEA